MVVSNRSGSLVLCGEAGNPLVPPSTQGCSPERSIIITEPEQEFSVKAPHCQGEISVVFVLHTGKGSQSKKSSNSKTEHFLTKGEVALLLYLLFPWSLSQAGKQHPKVRSQSKTGELYLV